MTTGQDKRLLGALWPSKYTYIDARSGEKRISFLLILRCVFTQVNNVNVFFF